LFNHPQVGPLALNYERLPIPGSGMQALVTYHAQPGSDSEERLRRLDTITTDPGPDIPVRPRPARPHTPTPDY
jgi:transcription regulator MmyB-like protein